MLTTSVYTYPVVFSCKCEEPFNSFVCFEGEVEAATDEEAKEKAMRLFNEPPDTSEGRAFANVLKHYNVPVKHLQWQDWRGPWQEPLKKATKVLKISIVFSTFHAKVACTEARGFHFMLESFSL